MHETDFVYLLEKHRQWLSKHDYQYNNGRGLFSYANHVVHVCIQTIKYEKKNCLLYQNIIMSPILYAYIRLTIYVESPLADNLGDSKVIHYWPLTRVCQLIKPYVHIYIHREPRIMANWTAIIPRGRLVKRIFY